MIELGIAVLIWLFVVVMGALALPFAAIVFVGVLVLAYVFGCYLQDQAHIWLGHRRKRRHARWNDK